MSTRRVYNVLHHPVSGLPIAGKKATIELAFGGFAGGGTVEIASRSYVVTDSTGRWQADLVPNAEIDPVGSWYTVRELPGVVWPFVVPAGIGDVPLHDLLVDAPGCVPPVPIAPLCSIPPGGATGQVLAKATNTDCDTVWADVSGGGGGGSAQVFVVSVPTGSWTFVHNLGRRPIVNVYDAAGQEWVGDISADNTSVTVLWATPNVGSVVLI